MKITLPFITGLALILSVGSNKIIPPSKLKPQDGTVRKTHDVHPLVKFKDSKGANDDLKDLPKSLGIIGGTDTNITQHPYQVAIDSNKTFMCSGALLNRVWVATLASCTCGAEPSDLTVRMGSDYSSYGGTVYNVTDIVTHPHYNYETMDFDFSLVKIEVYLCFDEYIRLISFSQQPPQSGFSGAISGWGYDGQSTEGKLRQLNMSVVEPQKCREQYNVTGDSVTDRMFCAVAGTSGPCFGDFGNPLVVDGTLHGLYSWSRGCARPDFPAVFASIASVADWIRQQMDNSCTCGVY